jgi:hypothetical protein
MPVRTWIAALSACAMLCACSKSEDPDTQGGPATGAGNGGAGEGAHLAGHDGHAGRAGGDPADACMDRAHDAMTAVLEAVMNADLSCAARADCEMISIDTDCHAACGALVSVDGKASVVAVIDAQNAGICAGFEADGCRRIIPPCVQPLGFDCVQGRCEWLERPPQDAGSDAGAGPDAAADGGAAPDAGGDAGDAGGDPGCLDRALSWGHDGGRVAYRDVHRLAPCRAFSIVRSTPGDPATGPSCENEVTADAAVTVDDVDVALAHPHVAQAMADAAVLYGSDPRPFDGTVFRIEVGSAIIDVGSDCSGGSVCAAIPSGVAALRSTLQALADQQRALPDCDQLP